MPVGRPNAVAAHAPGLPDPHSCRQRLAQPGISAPPHPKILSQGIIRRICAGMFVKTATSVVSMCELEIQLLTLHMRHVLMKFLGLITEYWSGFLCCQGWKWGRNSSAFPAHTGGDGMFLVAGFEVVQ
jgi:hypothetical protein